MRWRRRYCMLRGMGSLVMQANRGTLRLAQGLALVALFLLALAPRLYSAQTLGWGWDGPGTFNLVNFDEAGSCRAALDGFEYSSFIGKQTIAIASALGMPPPDGIRGDAARVKAYCHSAGHIMVARSWSALLGALTVVAVVVLCWQLVPGQPFVAWGAGGLLALSGFHLSQSQSGTVDAPSTFFIYLFLAVLAWSLRRRSLPGLALSPVLMAAAIWTKYWVFAALAWAAVLPGRLWGVLTANIGPLRFCLMALATITWLASVANAAYPHYGWPVLLAAYYCLLPWRRLQLPVALLWALVPLLLWWITRLELFQMYSTGGLTSRFGSGYAAIGENKWLRNIFNMPLFLFVSLGIPACLFIPLGLRAVIRDEANRRYWLCLLPLLIFAVFMAFFASITYYRHYLPLVPVAAILSCLGLQAMPWARRRWFLLLFFSWPALLAWDMVADYHHDPRQQLRPWFAQHPNARVFTSFYVNPPASARVARFQPEYAQGDAAMLQRADFLVLSESWYDTAFANELNGPLVDQTRRLVKTRPEYARFYRQALAGEHPWLEHEQAWTLSHFMPELLLHKMVYGNVQLFVGDLHILRVRK